MGNNNATESDMHIDLAEGAIEALRGRLREYHDVLETLVNAHDGQCYDTEMMAFGAARELLRRYGGPSSCNEGCDIAGCKNSDAHGEPTKEIA